ncbi:hypothetical protein GIB67_001156 [Kingdonia uniflora]|uniref:Uncharacterized protein n=1 Tax=Kingdonia uniflora TaxID=39325 RepID=A0A7J7LGH0_9MAGN|nr:hypothetical protein GIB67_001156 [Kingdonia uniflora]
MVSLFIKMSALSLTETPNALHDDQVGRPKLNGTLNAQCVAYKGIVAQKRFRNDNGKTEEDQENDAHKIYQGLNGGNDFKHCEAYKILAREPRWANLRDDGLNHVGNVPKNVVRRTSDNSSLGNSVGSNNLSEAPDGPPTPQYADQNSKVDGSLYDGGSRPISKKLFRKNHVTQRPWMVLLHLNANWVAQSNIRLSEEDDDTRGGSSMDE